MMSNPLVSVVIPTFNRFEEAQKAIASAIAQTYRPIEIVIVEDGSNSGVEKWVDNIVNTEDMRVLYFRNVINKGLSATKNLGVFHSSGDYVAILDDDDEWKPEKLYKQMGLVRSFESHNGERLGVVSTAVEIRYKDSLVIDIAPCGNRGLLKDDIIASEIRTPSSTFLFPRQVILECGGYDESLKSSTDHDMMMSLADKGYFGIGTDEPLTINYSRIGRATNMTNTDQRIESVYQFLGKWESTYEHWFGPDGAAAYNKKYFAVVITMLLANKLFSKNYREAWRCFREIIRYSGFNYLTVTIIAKPILKNTVKICIPDKLLCFIKRRT